MVFRLVGPFTRFLIGFAGEAKGSHRARLQPFQADLIAALLAPPIIPLLNTGEGLVDFGQQLTFPIPNPKQQVAIGFQRGPVRGVGEPFARLFIHRAECSVGLRQDFAFATFEKTAKEIKLPLPHNERGDH